MKIGYISNRSISLGYQEAFLAEGHQLNVWYWSKDNKSTDITGLAKKYPDQLEVFPGKYPELARMCRESDFVMSDYNKLPRRMLNTVQAHCDSWALPTLMTDSFEYNRAFGKIVAQFIGFHIPPAGRFCRLQKEAFQYLTTLGTGGVMLKGNDDSVKCNSVQEAMDIVQADPFNFFTSQRYIHSDGRIKTFKLDTADQGVYIEQVVHGKEVSFGGYFNGEHFMRPLIGTREYKGACNDDRGQVLTGEIGTAVRFLEDNELPEEVFKALMLLEKPLRNADYHGYFDINTIVDVSTTPAKIYFLEFTTRIGYPSCESHVIAATKGKMGYGKLWSRIARATHEEHFWDLIDPDLDHSIGIGLFAYGLGLKSMDGKIQEFKPQVHGYDFASNLPEVSVVPFSASYINDKLHAQEWDRALFVIAQGQEWEYSVERACQVIQKVNAWGYTYRDDIGQDLVRDDYLERIYNSKFRVRGFNIPGDVNFHQLHQIIDTQADQILFNEKWTSEDFFHSVWESPNEILNWPQRRGPMFVISRGEFIVGHAAFSFGKDRSVIYWHSLGVMAEQAAQVRIGIKSLGHEFMYWIDEKLKAQGVKQINAHCRGTVLRFLLRYGFQHQRTYNPKAVIHPIFKKL